MASHDIVGNARDSSAQEERSQDLPVAFLSAGHRFAPLRGRTAPIDTFFVAQMGLRATTARCAWVTMRREANRSKFKRLTPIHTFGVTPSATRPFRQKLRFLVGVLDSDKCGAQSRHGADAGNDRYVETSHS
jgi:hypothetical protein